VLPLSTTYSHICKKTVHSAWTHKRSPKTPLGNADRLQSYPFYPAWYCRLVRRRSAGLTVSYTPLDVRRSAADCLYYSNP
jgi:hypothetical protein